MKNFKRQVVEAAKHKMWELASSGDLAGIARTFAMAQENVKGDPKLILELAAAYEENSDLAKEAVAFVNSPKGKKFIADRQAAAKAFNKEFGI